MKNIFLAILFLAFSYPCFAQEKVGFEDRIIGSTFKVLSKTFVAAADINALKKNNIDKLNRMDENKFREKYSEVYEVLKDLPAKLKGEYGVTEGMTKEQAIEKINALDKKKLYELIDAIPDNIIAREFKEYVSQAKQDGQEGNWVEQINEFWDKTMKKININK